MTYTPIVPQLDNIKLIEKKLFDAMEERRESQYKAKHLTDLDSRIDQLQREYVTFELKY